MVTLQTSRMVLRRCEPADRDDFIALEQDPAVMLYLNGGKPVTQSESDADSLFLMPRGTEDDVWTARRRETNSFVGWFCFWHNQPGEAELGYRLRRQEWGQGLAAEGAAALIDWGFTEAGVGRVTACTMVSNRASRKVLEKVGFTVTSIQAVDWAADIPGGDQGEIWYEKLKATT